jgi:addiction module HigA family antidote
VIGASECFVERKTARLAFSVDPVALARNRTCSVARPLHLRFRAARSELQFSNVVVVQLLTAVQRATRNRHSVEQTDITADTALRLAKAFGTTAQLWLNLQNDYDVQLAKRDLGKILDRIETVNKTEAA